MDNNSERGFTLIELMMVVAIMLVLVAIALPTLASFRDHANDSRAKADVSHAATAELGVRVLTGSFTGVAADLDAMVQGMNLSGTDESIHLIIGDVQPGDGRRVLLYARSRSGTWFGIHLAEDDAETGRYTCTGAAEADMTLAACVGKDW